MMAQSETLPVMITPAALDIARQQGISGFAHNVVGTTLLLELAQRDSELDPSDLAFIITAERRSRRRNIIRYDASNLVTEPPTVDDIPDNVLQIRLPITERRINEPGFAIQAAGVLLGPAKNKNNLRRRIPGAVGVAAGVLTLAPTSLAFSAEGVGVTPTSIGFCVVGAALATAGVLASQRGNEYLRQYDATQFGAAALVAPVIVYR